MKLMVDLECETKPSQILSNFVNYKVRSLKILQESFRICNWLMEKECNEIDNIFDINSYIDKILDACTDKDDPLDSMNTLFEDCFMNTNNFCLSFYGNIALETSTDSTVITQTKKEHKRSQKRRLEEQIVPDEVYNCEDDNDMQVILIAVKNCLQQAIQKNNGNPISFFKFAINPYSLSQTIENFFHLASLVKDRIVIIEKNSDCNDFESATITINKKKINMNVTRNRKDDFISSLLTINHDLWKFYIQKYNIQEQMIDLR
ncbi:EP300-interacting inhibitor of differentiation 3-like [Sipha flava]|uniref:Non-structural maintenance of chromosomes element 4 n=1 Tax=Sipha flava TaxID=143950 RepID=A0A8B8GN65_9HEMI|nr:EP300-interacting inhibitor of differentiation 3-like [Sipha flava]